MHCDSETIAKARLTNNCRNLGLAYDAMDDDIRKLTAEEFNAIIDEAGPGSPDDYVDDGPFDFDDDHGFIPWETLPEMAIILHNVFDI